MLVIVVGCCSLVVGSCGLFVGGCPLVVIGSSLVVGLALVSSFCVLCCLLLLFVIGRWLMDGQLSLICCFAVAIFCALVADGFWLPVGRLLASVGCWWVVLVGCWLSFVGCCLAFVVRCWLGRGCCWLLLGWCLLD